jgi:hypothetical protein
MVDVAMDDDGLMSCCNRARTRWSASSLARYLVPTIRLSEADERGADARWSCWDTHARAWVRMKDGRWQSNNTNKKNFFSSELKIMVAEKISSLMRMACLRSRSNIDYECVQ